MGNPAEKFHFTPQEEVPKSSKPKLRLIPPENLRQHGELPHPQEDKQALVPIPDKIVLGAEYQPSDLLRTQEKVDIGGLLEQKEHADLENKEEDEKQLEALEAAIAAMPEENPPPMDVKRTIENIGSLPPVPAIESTDEDIEILDEEVPPSGKAA